jgi:hypothetical protein
MRMSKTVAPQDQDAAMISLGNFADGARSWDRMISNAGASNRVKVFRNCCSEGAGFVSRGADRTAIADELTELAQRHNLEKPLGGDDGIQQTISDAFRKADKRLADHVAEVGRAGNAKSALRLAVRGSASRFAERFQLTRLADIVLDNEPMYVVEGIIPAGPALGVIFGQPKTGKTFLAADLSLHIALGRNYCGCSVRQGAVVYVTSEGVPGFKRRMIAMREYYNAHSEVPFFVAYVMPNLGAISGDAEALVDLVRAAIPEGVPVAAIFIDTLARAMTGMSDSDTATMSAFVDNCDTIAKAFDCFVGVVHHSPRADETRSRGSNVLDGAADVIVSVVKDGSDLDRQG